MACGHRPLSMKQFVHSPDPSDELPTGENCHILEVWNNETDNAVSLARARLEPGMTTKLHRLKGVDERYLIMAGTGIARVGDSGPVEVRPGDMVIIPSGISQQISNSGKDDLVFLCVCTPRFTRECYEALE